MSILDSKKPVLIILILLISFWIYRIGHDEYYLKNSETAIGKIYEEYMANSALYIKYKYKVQDKWFHGKTSPDKKGLVGSFFYVKYSIEKPDIGRILFEKPIKDTLKIKSAGFTIE